MDNLNRIIYGGGFLSVANTAGIRACHRRSLSYSSSRTCRLCAIDDPDPDPDSDPDVPRVSSANSPREISMAIALRLHASSKYWLTYAGRELRCDG